MGNETSLVFRSLCVTILILGVSCSLCFPLLLLFRVMIMVVVVMVRIVFQASLYGERDRDWRYCSLEESEDG